MVMSPVGLGTKITVLARTNRNLAVSLSLKGEVSSPRSGCRQFGEEWDEVTAAEACPVWFP
jgi:hypothetical protein